MSGCGIRATELRGQWYSQTEFGREGNEGMCAERRWRSPIIQLIIHAVAVFDVRCWMFAASAPTLIKFLYYGLASHPRYGLKIY